MDRKSLCAGLTVCLSLAACSSRPEVTVGSKNFTEQVILGEIAAQQLERRLHLPVKRALNLGGTLLAHQALENRQIDLYPEYSGTAFTAILHHRDAADPGQLLDQVRAEYASALQLKWMDPLGFNDSFAMVITQKVAREKHLETLTDATAVPGGWKLGTGYEFLERPDGFRALLSVYPKMRWTAPPKTMDLGLLYKALDQNQVDMVAGNTTDAALSRADLKILADDQHGFPPYQASFVVRYDSLSRIPGLEASLAELTGKISDSSMRQMNAEVDMKHRPVRAVAADFLRTVP